MTIKSSGVLSFSEIVTEFGGGIPHTLLEYYSGGSYVPTGIGIPASGTISFLDFYGKSKKYVFSAVIAANIQNYNLKSAAIADGWDQTTVLDATITINSGIVIGSSSTGSYAFNTGVTFPAGTTLKLINNGSILGAGGAGGAGSTAGGAGGPSVWAQFGISITNNGTIGGGGGGGGGSSYTYDANNIYHSGEGGGGGAGKNWGTGGTGSVNNGSAGSLTVGGNGGALYNWPDVGNRDGGYTGTGGTGGNLGAAGLPGQDSWHGDPGGGGYNMQYPGAGGSAGAATSGNSKITWVTAGSRIGALN